MNNPDTASGRGTQRWLLLVHQLPSKPAYPRVKAWRRLQALGAVAVKSSVYVLPAGEQAQEDFEWLLREIVGDGGEGLICEARLVDGLSDAEVRALFNAAREADYDGLAQETRALGAALLAGTISLGEARTKATRLRVNLGQIVGNDFFGANGREVIEGLLGALEHQLRDEETEMAPIGEEHGGAALESLRARVWVTRRGVYVDRMASAWLIRRFIDREARFKFVPSKGYAPEPGELRFDMYEGEFTHEGDHCTFEVLVACTGLQDPALEAIGQIVHDVDMKDNKYGREEAGGIARLVEGIAAAHPDDSQRIDRGAAVFDDLYEVFRRKRR